MSKLLDKFDKSIIEQLAILLKEEKNDKHDLLVEEFFSHCLQKCKEEKPEFGMSAD